MKLERQRTPSDIVWREFFIQKKNYFLLVIRYKKLLTSAFYFNIIK